MEKELNKKSKKGKKKKKKTDPMLLALLNP